MSETPQQHPLLCWPLDHFYSPVPNHYLLAREPARSRVWPPTPGATPGIDWREEHQVSLLRDTFAAQSEFLFPDGPSGDRHEYHPSNEMFPRMDAHMLQAMLRHLRPRRMIEVGCGWSSLVTARVNRECLGGELQFTCIEPHPPDFLQDGVDGISQLIASPVEELPLDLFLELEDRDVLFIDTSHNVKTGNDVAFLYNEVLPRLAPGVVVHIHDIFLPWDYPPDWVLVGRAWNEQYLLRAFLSFNAGFEILLGVAWLRQHRPDVLTTLPGYPSKYPNGGSSLWIQRADSTASWKQRAGELDEQIRTLRASEIQTELNDLRLQVKHRAIDIETQRKRLEQLNHRFAEDQQVISSLQYQLRRVNGSVTWELLQRARGWLYRALGGEQSLPAWALQRSLRAVGRRLRTAPGPSTAELTVAPEFEIPPYPQPTVSIVIALHARADLTQACLQSLLDHTTGVGYEVILVDDTADKGTKELLQRVRGARVLVNSSNLGYLRTINRGASLARGHWVLMCNNDIEFRDGWLTAMIDCGESAPDIAIVTPKYVFPDGRLNEAGGIVWRDGNALNYGRGDSPVDYRYEYRREVDYGSGAALLVRADFWREVGGLDERFAPIYYEDADLCFQAREHDLRVMYEPRAKVVHVEGATSGTDIASGDKRYQEINRPKFADKWRHRLDQHPPSSNNARRAADRRRGPHVLIVDHRVPMWDRDSGSLRLRGLIEALLGFGCRVTFFPDIMEPTLPYTLELQRMGVEVLYGRSDAAAELAAIGPGLSAVITCRPHTTSRWLDRLREYAPSAPIAYDTIDLHWLREARRTGSYATEARSVVAGSRAGALRELELAVIRATEATLVVTADERNEVQLDVPHAAVYVVPNVNEIRNEVPPPVGRSGVVFIGGFEFDPNVSAAVRLVKAIMPLVWRELGEIPVTIIGESPPAEVTELASRLVEVTGWVEDVDPLFDRARAMVAPLTWGAGLKGKVTQSLATGLPVVTTPIGAEGLDAVDGQHLLVAEDDGAFAERVIRLLRDDALWTRLSKAGQELAAERCSPEVMAERVGSLLEGLGVLSVAEHNAKN